jgi:hypothetical protein
MFSQLDITLFPNRIRLTNSRTGQSIDRSSAKPFSSEHRMLADREVAAKFLVDLVRESERSRARFLMLWPKAVVTIAEGRCSKYDREEVHQFLIDAGFRSAQVSCGPDADCSP